MQSTLEQAGGSTESRRGDLSPSSSSTNWDRHNWTTRSWNSWHSSRSDNFRIFLTFSTSFGCREKLPVNRACTDAYSVTAHTLNSMITFHHANTHGSRAHKLKVARIGVLKQLSSTCHVSFLAATSPFCPTISPSHPSPLAHDPYFTLRRFTAEWRINSHPISHRL